MMLYYAVFVTQIELYPTLSLPGEHLESDTSECPEVDNKVMLSEMSRSPTGT